ncbi:MAG: hypothetical protein ACFCBW_09040 [Candidatus Competibacterales bacterium]
MSRAYRLHLAESLRRHLVVADGITTQLELLPVLPEVQLAALLQAELEAQGFQGAGDRWRQRLASGVELSIDPRDGSVHLGLQREREVAVERTLDTTVDEEFKEAARQRLGEQLRLAMAREIDGQQRELQGQVTRALAAELAEVRGELDRLAHRVTAAALKLKASQLGTVETVEDDEANGALTLRVRL